VFLEGVWRPRSLDLVSFLVNCYAIFSIKLWYAVAYSQKNYIFDSKMI
jgi:hypothetical protein